MFREDREAHGQRQPAQGLPVGNEPREDHEDGRGGRKVVEKGPDGNQEGNAHAR